MGYLMHKSVLLNESINGLNIKEDGIYVKAYVPANLVNKL